MMVTAVVLKKMNLVKCLNCGAENKDGARFCRDCGDSLVEAEMMQEELLVNDDLEEEHIESAVILPAEETAQADHVDIAPGDVGLAEAAAEDTTVPLLWAEEEETTAAIAPPEIGTLVHGCYELLERMIEEDEYCTYIAADLCRCPHCGVENIEPGEIFCPDCGAELVPRPKVELVVSPHADIAAQLDLQVREAFSEGELFYVVVAEDELPAPSAEFPAFTHGVRLVAAHQSDAGMLRELDEDSVFSLTVSSNFEAYTAPVVGLYIVADGMGGHEGGEVASKGAIRIMAEHLFRTIIVPEMSGEHCLHETVIARLDEAVQLANRRVFEAQAIRRSDMGTTLTAAVVLNDAAYIINVGDSRTYHWNAAGLTQITNDHSLVASLVASGSLAPEGIYTHPNRNIIYRCIGEAARVDTDIFVQKLLPGDRLLLCSDGLWEMIRSEGIAEVLMQEADPRRACAVMVERANAAGGEDNISVLVVNVEQISSSKHS